MKLITEKMIKTGMEIGIVKIIDSPNGDGFVCQIGGDQGSWFYFGGLEAEESTAEEYLRNVPTEDITREIYEALNSMSNEVGSEAEDLYFLCLKILNEGLPNEMPAKFRVKIPGGWLLVEEKGAYGEYPGVFISFSQDGKSANPEGIIACVEYDTCSEEIITESYAKESEEPVSLIVYEDGRDKLS